MVRDQSAKITRCELRLPLADLGVKSGESFGFNIVILDDDDGAGSRYWFQLAPGLCGRTPKAPRKRFTNGIFLLNIRSPILVA